MLAVRETKGEETQKIQLGDRQACSTSPLLAPSLAHPAEKKKFLKIDHAFT